MASGSAVLACLNIIPPPPPASSHPSLSLLSPPSSPTPTDATLPHAFGPQDTAHDHDDQLRSTEDGNLGPDMPDDQTLATGLQRLQLHRSAIAGKVMIPDTWRWEQSLQDWVNYGEVEDALRPADLISARNALVSECQRRRNALVSERQRRDEAVRTA